MAGYVLKERTYVNADKTKVVPEGDPEAAFMLGIEGTTIDEMEARKLGIYSDLEPVGPPKNPELLRRQRVAAGDQSLAAQMEKRDAIDAALLEEDYERAHALITEMEEAKMNQGDVETKNVTPQSAGAQNKAGQQPGTPPRRVQPVNQTQKPVDDTNSEAEENK